MNLANIALDIGRSHQQRKSDEIPDIIEFVESPWGLDQRLFPVQKVILKAHYGIALDDHEKCITVSDWKGRDKEYMTEAEYLRYLYKRERCNIEEVIPGKERREMILSIGRRSGKSFITACIIVYETYKLLLRGDAHNYYGLPSSNPIQLIAVATDKDQAGLLYTETSGMFAKCDVFKAYAGNNTQSFAKFQTPSDINKFGRWTEKNKARCSLNVTFRSCIAKGLRGAGNIVVALDEVAHFLPSGQGSAETVYDAITPSTAAFSQKDSTGMPLIIHDDGSDEEREVDSEGRIIMISSPAGKQGFFYEQFQMGFLAGEGSEDVLCIQAPTWEVNPTITRAYFRKKYAKNPVVFMTEFGAFFSDRTRGWIGKKSDLRVCIDKSLRPVRQGISRQPYFMGVDIGLTAEGDGTAIAIGHINYEGKIVLDFLEWIHAGEGRFEGKERLDVVDDIAEWILQLSKKFYIVEGIADQYSGIPFEQALHKRGLKQIKYKKFTRDLSSQIFQNFKDMMWDGRLLLFDYPIPENKDHCSYISELFELQSTRHSKYITTIEKPKVRGKYDDQADALVRMIWLASQQIGKKSYISSPMQQNSAAIHALRAHRRALMGGSSPDRQTLRRRRRR